MSKRRYTNMLVLLPVIEKMMAAGMSHREIEDALGLEGDRPTHNLLKRQRRKAAKGVPKYRRRKPAKTLQEYKHENKRLKMEVTAGFSAVYRKEVRPKVEYAVVYRHRNEYPVYRKCSAKSRLFRKMRNPKTLDLQGFSGS